LWHCFTTSPIDSSLRWTDIPPIVLEFDRARGRYSERRYSVQFSYRQEVTGQGKSKRKSVKSGGTTASDHNVRTAVETSGASAVHQPRGRPTADKADHAIDGSLHMLGNHGIQQID
jgi:hypothetical protein